MTPGLDPLKLMREMRDAAMDRWAKVALRMTSSHEYQHLQGAVMKPTLLAMALYRKAAESAMSDVLAGLNMPSRDEVLQLSRRLTHIEMALDDLGAAVDQLRRGQQRPQRASARERDGNGEPRPPVREA